MEIEDPDATAISNIVFVRPPPPSEPPKPQDDVPPPPPPLPRSSPNSPQSPVSPESPTLAELERKKKLLLQELNTSVIEIDDSLVDEIIALENSVEDGDEVKEFSSQQENDDNSMTADLQITNEDNSKDSCKSSEITNPDDIEKSYMGTPIIKFSPYDNLPNGENFKVGVSDVINFENLPDSTGKYENMKELIKKVRTVIHKLHSDD